MSMTTYDAALRDVLYGCFPEDEHVTGACDEYTRGVLNALAEVFAIHGVFTSDRMDEILADLKALSDARRLAEHA